MTLAITEIAAPFGAEVKGVDLTRPIDNDTFDRIQQAFLRHQLLVFRDNEFSEADQIRFTARFGEIRKSNMEEYLSRKQPEVFLVSNIKEGDKHVGVYDAGLFWHSDGSFMPTPHGALALHAPEVPHDSNDKPLGDTVFASTSAAYEALSPAMKKRLEGLQGLNTLLLRYEKTVGGGRKTDVLTASAPREMETAHPVARPHPITGRKCIYVNEGYTARILGLREEESRGLIAELTAHCARPEFLYRHSWRMHDFVVWDNHSTQHKATFDYALPQRRLMHRTAAIF